MNHKNKKTFKIVVRRFLLCIHMLVYILWGELSFAAVIDNIRLSYAESGVRVVFDMDKTAEHKLFLLENPHRLVVDISNTQLDVDLSQLSNYNEPIQAIRSAPRNNTDLRIVFDLSFEIKAQSFVLSENDQYGDRLVIDLKLLQPRKNRSEASASLEVRSKLQRDLIIAIDAGHGGEDPGAVGVNNMYEKAVVMSIATKLVMLFNREKGYKAVLIRRGDYFVSLADRRELARKANADMFISVHADSFTNKKAHGASVFTLSSKGATSASAKFLAERENRADLVGGVSLNDKDDVLSSVLVDLSMTYKMESSYDVAQSVLKSLGKVTKLHGSKVEKAAFAVLKTPDIPSILVETGFMSNPKEAKKLASKRHQLKIANAIFSGVNHYFQEKAPEGTYIASKFRHNRATSYVVEPGDSLSKIALQYNVSMKQIIRLNKLSGRTLQIGQILKIP